MFQVGKGHVPANRAGTLVVVLIISEFNITSILR